MVSGLVLLTTACADDVIEPQNAAPGYTGYNAAQLLQNVSNNVIPSTYQDLVAQTVALDTACARLQRTPDAARLDDARAAYRAARAPWEATEAFAFGPVSTQLLDARIDTWPLDTAGLRTLLRSTDPLTSASLEQVGTGLQGFHPIEYLLFGENAAKPAAALTARELRFLRSAAANLRVATGQLLRAWQGTGGGFANTLASAGVGNAVYPSQRAALQELADGLSAAATELADSKIERPVASGSTQFEEARYSKNSKAEFVKNLQGIENVYLGRYGAGNPNAGLGLSELVRRRNPEADARLQQQLTEAQTAIQALPGSFDEAIVRNPAAVRAAQAKVKDVQASIDGPVAAAVRAL